MTETLKTYDRNPWNTWSPHPFCLGKKQKVFWKRVHPTLQTTDYQQNLIFASPSKHFPLKNFRQKLKTNNHFSLFILHTSLAAPPRQPPPRHRHSNRRRQTPPLIISNLQCKMNPFLKNFSKILWHVRYFANKKNQFAVPSPSCNLFENSTRQWKMNYSSFGCF